MLGEPFKQYCGHYFSRAISIALNIDVYYLRLIRSGYLSCPVEGFICLMLSWKLLSCLHLCWFGWLMQFNVMRILGFDKKFCTYVFGCWIRSEMWFRAISRTLDTWVVKH